MSKYHNIQWPDLSGFVHDSKREAHRANELLLMQRAGVITDLQQQVPFGLIPAQKLSNGKTEKGCTYVADFTYWENGRFVVEDAKGMRTEAYKIKRKLMLERHGIEIREV